MKLRKVTKWYHATDIDNANAILADGYIRPNKEQMIFLATSKQDAGFFMNARGRSEYAVFQIHRRDIEQKHLLINPATKGMVTAIYVKPIPVTAKNCIVVEDARDLTHGIPGVNLFTEGNGKTGFRIDTEDFTKHLKKQIGIDSYNKFTSLMDAGHQIEAELFLENTFSRIVANK